MDKQDENSKRKTTGQNLLGEQSIPDKTESYTAKTATGNKTDVPADTSGERNFGSGKTEVNPIPIPKTTETIKTDIPATSTPIDDGKIQTPEDQLFRVTSTLDINEMRERRGQFFVNEYLAGSGKKGDAKFADFMRQIYDGLVLDNEIKSSSIQFRDIETPEPYINYESRVMLLYKNRSKRLMSEITKIIAGSTMDTFPYGTAFTTFEYNQTYFKKLGMEFNNGVPYNTDIIQRLGYKMSDNDIYTYPAGMLLGILLVMQDTEIARIGEVLTPMSHDNTALEDLMTDHIKTPVYPNPAMLSAIGDVPWIRDGETQLLARDDVNYVLGKIVGEDNAFFGVKEVDIHGWNIDHYKASILNFNLRTLLTNRGSVAQRRNGLLAHAFTTSSITMTDDHQLRPEMPPNRDDDIRTLVLLACRMPLLQSLISTLNVEYVASTGFIRPIATNFYYPDKFTENSNTKTLTSLLSRLAGVANISQLHLAVAREITPQFTVRRMVEINEEFDTPESIIIIMQLVLFSIIFPAQFNSIRGDVQTILLRFFQRWYTPEFLQFIAQYGIRYRIDENQQQQFEPGNQAPWDQQEYLSESYPSLFSGVAFQMQNIRQVMEMFTPQGILVEDTRAVTADFPRLVNPPTHYIALTPNVNPGSSVAISRIKNSLDILGRMAATYATRQNQPSARKTVTKEWISHVQTRIGNVSQALFNHYPHVLQTMANFRLNFTPNFSGQYATDKPKNYTIRSVNNGTLDPMMIDRGDTADGLSRIDTGIIWPFLMQSEFPLVRNLGVSADKVPISEEIIFPDPGMSYLQHEHLMHELRGIRLVDAFMSLVDTPSSVLVTEYEIDNLPVDDPDNTIRVIANAHYAQIIRAILLDTYPQEALTVTANTTLPEVIAYLLENGNIVVIAGQVQLNVMNHLRESATLLVVGDAWRNWITLPQGAVIQPAPLNSEYVEVYQLLELNNYALGIEELDVLRALLPRMSDSQYRKMYDTLSRLLKLRTAPYAMILSEFLGPMRRQIRLTSPQIRRYQYGNVMRYDEHEDIPAFQFAFYFLSREEIERLRIGLKMFVGGRMPKPRQGLRLFVEELNAFDPDYLPDPMDRPVVEYNFNMFSQRRDGHSIRLIFIHNGIEYVNATTWPSIHLIIPDRSRITAQHMSGILQGIDKAKWMVDIKDAYYIPAIYAPSEDIQKIDYETVLLSQRYVVSVIPFIDSLLEPDAFQNQIGRVESSTQSIFPLERITNNRAVRALVQTQDQLPLEGSHLNSIYEIDTGTITAEGELRYTTGIDKLDLDEISMTNRLVMLSSNVKLNQPMVYQYKAPDDIQLLQLG